MMHKRFCARAHMVLDDSEALETDSQGGGPAPSESTGVSATLTSSACTDQTPSSNDTDQRSSPAATQQRKLTKDGRPKESGGKLGTHRRSHTLYYKYQVAMDYALFEDMKQQGIINDPLSRTLQMYEGEAKSNVFKWFKQLQELKDALLHEHSVSQSNRKHVGKVVPFNSRGARKMSLHHGRKVLYAAAELELLHLFRRERRRGLRINDRWLCVKMKSLVRTHFGEEASSRFKASHGWLLAFADRQNLSLRRVNNIKHAPVEERLPRIKRWHARLRRRLKVKPSLGSAPMDPVWGRWLPKNRLSCDQVPCNLREGVRATYEERGAGRIWIAGNKADDGKRFCTLQIIARAENGPADVPRRGQPPIGIIFKGTGARVSDEEKRSWHPDVRVRFQKKAWADAEYCEAHAKKEMAEATAEARARGEESVCFYDNLHGQTTLEHEKLLLKQAHCVRHLLPAGVTSEIQLIDDGIGYAVKKEMGHALDEWLSCDDNLHEWTSNMSAWRKRVQITHFAAAAWDRVCENFDFAKASTRIGMRMTIDGTGDELIKIQGVANYSFSDADAGEDAPGEAIIPAGASSAWPGPRPPPSHVGMLTF